MFRMTNKTRKIISSVIIIILILATYFTQGLAWDTAILTIINAVLVALTAMGGYELTFAKLEKLKAKQTEQ